MKDMKKKRNKKTIYQKPKIIVTKIAINFFSRNNRFYTNFGDNLLAQLCGDDPYCSRSCFLSGTNILMHDGSTKSIENIKINDNVASFYIKKKTLAKSKVAKLFINFNDSGFYHINDKIKVTKYHRFWVNGSMWKRTYLLKTGDYLLNAKNEKIRINKIERMQGVNMVYNLHLKGKNHNFFAEDVLVHNWK